MNIIIPLINSYNYENINLYQISKKPTSIIDVNDCRESIDIIDFIELNNLSIIEQEYFYDLKIKTLGKILKDCFFNIYVDFIQNIFDNLKTKNSQILFTDKKYALDLELYNLYKVDKNKIIYLHKNNKYLNNYTDIKDFKNLMITNVNIKKIIHNKLTDIKKYSKYEILDYVKEIFIENNISIEDIINTITRECVSIGLFFEELKNILNNETINIGLKDKILKGIEMYE